MGYISSDYSNEISIMMDFCKFVNRKIQASNGKPFEVKNPVIDEVLTEKWKEDEKNYTDFVNMMEALTEDLNKLNSDDSVDRSASEPNRIYTERIIADNYPNTQGYWIISILL